MQKRLALSFENRDPQNRRSRQRGLRQVGALALLLCAFGAAAGGCSRQAEGERCDHTANGDDDCDEGLECVRPRGGTVDRCCPPAGAPIDDARCNGSDAPIDTETGGTTGETGGTTGETGGTTGETGGTTGETGGTTGESGGTTSATGGVTGEMPGAGGNGEAGSGTEPEAGTGGTEE